jgi:hypothetical protein
MPLGNPVILGIPFIGALQDRAPLKLPDNSATQAPDAGLATRNAGYGQAA